MKFFIYASYQAPQQHDFYITQLGDISPPPPASFRNDAQIGVMLEAGDETPSQSQRLALFTLAMRGENEFNYAFVLEESTHEAWYKRSAP